MSIQQMLLGAGAAVTDTTYVDDCFSTYVYTGDGESSRAINTGFDFNDTGGMVWFKARSASHWHIMFDTVRGANKSIYPNDTWVEESLSSTLNAFNNNGFTIGYNGAYTSVFTNTDDVKYVSYSFKKQPGFFDCVKYSGNDGTAFNVSHSLGVKPGAILIKALDQTASWYWWSKGMATANKYLKFDAKGSIQTSTAYAVGANLTSTTFEVPTGSNVNGTSSQEYIAYLWADGDESAAQIFGESGDKPIIKIGSYTGSGGDTPLEVDLGFEPQWLMIKRFDAGEAEHWFVIDTMRGWSSADDSYTKFIRPDGANGESQESSNFKTTPTPTGFRIEGGRADYNQANGDYLYMAIRRSDGYVGKPVTLGTDVFAMDTWVSDSADPAMISNFPVDFVLDRDPTHNGSWEGNWHARARLITNKYLTTNTNDANANGTWGQFDYNNGWLNRQGLTGYSDWQSWMWKRHKGMDVVHFKGTGSARTINHTMNGVPEFIILKNRETNSNQWYVYHKDLNNGSNPEDYYQRLGQYGNYAEAGDTGGALFNSTAPTSTVFSVGTSSAVNESGVWTLALLFRSISGICKTGTYTGNGSMSGPTVTLGFAPRLIILKAADRSGSWFVIDSLRGIGSGSGLLELNSNADQSGGTLVSSDSTSFTIVNSFAEVNDDGKRFIYYAHA